MIWRSLILGVGMATAAASGLAHAACVARTPEQAIEIATVASSKQSSSASSDSYRVAQILVDPELHRRWALIANCSHPERPLKIVALPEHASLPEIGALPVPPSPRIHRSGRSVPAEIVPGQKTSSPPTAVRTPPVLTAKVSVAEPSPETTQIRAGDLVRLWSSDGNVRLEMAVVSLEYGRMGQVIHLRRPGQTTLLAGMVVGADSAELIP